MRSVGLTVHSSVGVSQNSALTYTARAALEQKLELTSLPYCVDVCVRCAEGYQFARPSSAASARSAAAAGQTMTRFQQTLSRTAPVSSVPLNKYCVVVTDISLFVHNLFNI